MYMYVKIVQINKQLAENRSFEGNCEILRALSSDMPASRKGVYLFYSPQIHFSRRTHLDRFWILCGFLHVSLYEIVNKLFNFSVTSAKRVFFVFHDQIKV